MKWAWCLLIAVGLCLVAGLPARAATTELVSVSSTGEQGDADSYWPSISAGGRYVAFESYASSLVPGDTNSERDVFVRDRLTGATERVSVSGTGEQGNQESYRPAISADGRLVAFCSHAPNLVPGDTNQALDVFVHDRLTGATERVSVSSTAEQGNQPSGQPSMSSDGRFVAFRSWATDLVPGHTNWGEHVYGHDRLTGATERVSVSSAGEQENGDSDWPSMSADGRFVAFSSGASNLVPEDTNSARDVFVHDRLTGATERVSVSGAGEQGDGDSYWPSISADGRFVSFSSYAPDLVPGDTNSTWDVFIHDRLTGATERVSVSGAGEQGDSASWYSSVTADGQFVAFFSDASNLVRGDTNSARDVFVHDRLTAATERVSVSTAGEQGDAESSYASICADGHYVAFESYAPNLVPGDTNASADAFVRDRHGFPDVPMEHWAYDEIMACFNANIVKGYDDGLYHPEGQITRDQMAVYVARVL